jgi:hypothetical protein
MTKSIPLSQGKITLVDDEDYDYLNQWKWTYFTNSNCEYAARNQDKKAILMHRVILGDPFCNNGLDTDHINRDGLDNRKINLRFCTHQQNQWNRGKFKNNKSGFIGVYYERGKWRASSRANHTHTFIGYFDTAEEASQAYKQFVLKAYGEFAETNFTK